MKINNLLEGITAASSPENATNSAPKMGRSDKFLEDQVEESTTSGCVASVSAPVGKMQRRGKGSIFSGIKSSDKFPNSKVVKEGAYEDGVRDGIRGEANPRASSIYGPESGEYSRGYDDGLVKGKEQSQANVSAYQASLAPYKEIPTDKLKQMLRDIRKRSDEIQAIFNKYKGASLFGGDAPPNTEELRAEGKKNNEAWQAIHQELFQRGVPNDQRLEEDFEDLPTEIMDPETWKKLNTRQKFKELIDAKLITGSWTTDRSVQRWLNNEKTTIQSELGREQPMPYEFEKLDPNLIYRNALNRYKERKHQSDVVDQEREHELNIGAEGRLEMKRKADELAEMRRQQLRQEKMEDEELAFQRAETIQQRKDEMQKIADKYKHDLTVIDKEHRNNMEAINTNNRFELDKLDKEYADAQRERQHQGSETNKEMDDRERERRHKEKLAQMAADAEAAALKAQQQAQQAQKPQRPPRPSAGAPEQNSPQRPQTQSQKPPMWHTSQQVSTNKPPKIGYNNDVTDVEARPVKPNKPLQLGMKEAKKANTKTARKELSKKPKAELSGKDREAKQSEEDKLWAMLQQHMADKQKEVKEGEEMGTFAALKDWQVWNVHVYNNFYRGKYADYGPRLYSVVASSPEEARQVVIDNPDYVLQDLLSRKLQSGKRVLPRGSALPIEAKRVGKAEPGTISTMAFKKMLTPDGVQSFKFTNGKIVDGAHVQGGEQVEETASMEPMPEFYAGQEITWRPKFAKMIMVPATVVAAAPGKLKIKLQSPRLIQTYGKDTIVVNIADSDIMPKQGVAESTDDHRALGKHHEEMTDQELRKIGSKLPDSWDAAVLRRKLASHPKYAKALKHYDKSEYHFGKAAKQGVAEDQLDEKSKSQAQFRTMAAVAHNPKFAKKVGISQKVGKEFHSADRKQDYKDLPKEVDEEKQRLDPKCWTGYKKQGTKMKGGVRVNNCVKVDEAEFTEDKLASDLYRDLQIFKKGADKDIGSKAKDKEISNKAKDKDIVVKEEFNGEYDDEAGSAESNLLTTARAVKGLLDTIEDRDNLPEWVQEKIAKAEGMLVASWDYLQSQKEQGLDPQVHEDWQKTNKQDKTDGMSPKAVKAYRRENPGSKLQTAVTKKPSELKAGSKDAKRRKSFCARMSGNKGPMKDENGNPTPKAKALKRWNC